MDSKNKTRQSQATSNAARTLKSGVKQPTKVNSAERAQSVEEFKSRRPKNPNRENMTEWSKTNPNLKSNAARRVAKSPRTKISETGLTRVKVSTKK